MDRLGHMDCLRWSGAQERNSFLKKKRISGEKALEEKRDLKESRDLKENRHLKEKRQSMKVSISSGTGRLGPSGAARLCGNGSNGREQRPGSRFALALAFALFGLVLIASNCWAQNQPAPFDLVITNGHIIDGTGSPWYSGDIGIRDGKIAAIGNLSASPRTRTIDAAGKVVAPGFIDMLGQSELTILVDPRLPSKIFQGITTEITGEGGSVAPLNDAIIQADRSGYDYYKITPDWRTFRQYFARLEKQGIGINVADYVGATQVRRMVLGDGDKQPTPAELDQMRALVRQAMQDGTVGVSTALEYAPAPYAKTDELIALASEAAKFGGIYATHMRSESDSVLEAIDEALRIGREAHIPVEIWHIKVAGKANWGRMPEVVAKINAARASGADVTADTYAYTAWFNDFSAFVPPWAHDGGTEKLVERLKDPATRARIRQDMLTPSRDWDNEWQEIPGPDAIMIGAVQNPKLLPLQGKRLSEIAKLWNKDPIDALFDFLIEDPSTGVAVFGMSQPDVTLALQQPWVSIDNDSEGTSPEGILGQAHPHPRAYATFPRILRKYVREDKALTLEDAIRKFSALPAQRMRLADRGVLKAGMWADITIFDPETIHDRATFDNPNQLSEGMEYVLVNGVPVIDQGKMTGARPGKVLRGEGYVP
jgi:N-acyl-D-amino-acid deacylase